ncbi:LacI family transcriptional regulator [bacterium]|nr:LacI family transcriptional regulator [bacterium]
MKLEDIAAKCGVSASTVSRALNNDTRISRETTQKIHETAAKYSFTISKRKRPAGRSQVSLLLVIPDSSKIEQNPFFDVGEIINAINSAFYMEKTTIQIKTFSQLKNPNEIDDGNYSGVLFAFGKIDESLKARLVDRKIPFIFLNRTFEKENFVSCNNFKGVIKLMYYMQKRGLQRIGYLGCPRIAVNQDRFRGYCIANLELFGKVDQNLVYNVNSINEVDEACATFFNDRDCDAVFGFNDNYAIRLINALQSLGVKVPQDISVSGFDNSPLRSYFEPKLTTISLSTFEMGFFAARWLSDNIQHRETRKLRLEVDGELLEGKSVK